MIVPFESLDDFESREIELEGQVKTVYVTGTGPAVIVMSEMPGIYYHVARFARWVRDAGFTVYMPHLFGTDGKPPTMGYAVRSIARACISREFAAFAANRSSPVVDWLKALSAHAHKECGGKGVGAIGMCFTGNFALSMMVEPSMLAPVLSQPSLPLFRQAGMHISPEELRCVKDRLEAEDLTVLAYRFERDKLCPAARFADYEQALGERFKATVIPDEDAAEAPMAPHSVVTLHLVDEAGQPTRRAVDEILDFYRMRLK
ncbi:MAG: dienelactone hydrolase family protein [Pseudomonadales bacterium]|nr:dienelactone hydrolase family protein [Pseudomonadales bacterium]